MQLQLTEVVSQAPIDYGDKVVIYLSVPPLGREPRFEVVSRGKVISTYELFELIDAELPAIEELPVPPHPEPLVSSALTGEPEEEDIPAAEK